MSLYNNIAVVKDCEDLLGATRDLVSHGDTLTFVMRLPQEGMRFRSRQRNVEIDVAAHLLRSLYFRAVTDDISIESVG